MPRPNVLKMKSMERKGVVIGSGVCGKCGLNVHRDKQFHLCRRQWCRFLKNCLDDNRGGHCFGNIGGGGGLCKVAGWRPPASHRRKVRSIDCRADCAPVPRGLRENTQTNEHVLYLPQFTFFTRSQARGLKGLTPRPMSQGLKLPSTSGLG